MTNKEKLERAYELINEANKLIDDVANGKIEDDSENPVAEYINAINAVNDNNDNDCLFSVNTYGYLDSHYSDKFDNLIFNPYYQFLSREYADEAARLYKMICMQLAFKWCHDRDYVPDWTNADKFKWYVYRDTKNHSYASSYVCRSKNCADVYFSSEEIAKKCAAFPTDDGLIDTILHEILHTCPDSFNHGETWLAHCRTIYNNYGIKITVSDGYENKGADEVAYIATFRYVCRCKKCGAELGKNKMQDFIRYPQNYTHGGCGGEFERIK